MPSTAVSVLGVLTFIVVWVLLLKDRWRWLPLGRAASALLGSVVFVVLGVLDPNEALRAINMQVGWWWR